MRPSHTPISTEINPPANRRRESDPAWERLWTIKLPSDQHRHHRQDKENYAESDGDAKEGLFNAAAGRKHAA